MQDERGIGQLFLEESRERLKRHTTKLLQCLSLLPEEEIWKRPHIQVNSVGNLVLHLCGNVRQWIISGIGGAPDIRQRPQEFRPDAMYPKTELISIVSEFSHRALIGNPNGSGISRNLFTGDLQLSRTLVTSCRTNYLYHQEDTRKRFRPHPAYARGLQS